MPAPFDLYDHLDQIGFANPSGHENIGYLILPGSLAGPDLHFSMHYTTRFKLPVQVSLDVVGKMELILGTKLPFPQVIPQVRCGRRAEVDERAKERERATRTAARLQTMVDTTYDDYLAGNVDRETWQRAHQRHSTKLTQARVRIQQLDTGDSSLYDHAERLINTAVSASGKFETGNPAKKRSILKAVVSNCTLTSGNLHHTYKKPFDIIAEGSNTSDWWS